MSWAVLLSDIGTAGLGVVAELYGLSRSDRQRVLVLRDRAVEDWTWLARRRATTTRYVMRDVYVGRMVQDARVLRSGSSALVENDIALTARAGEAEVYVDENDCEGLLTDYLARPDAAGGVTVHAVDAAVLAHVRAGGSAVMTRMTVAVDLAESVDPRTRRAGHELVRRIAGG